MTTDDQGVLPEYQMHSTCGLAEAAELLAAEARAYQRHIRRLFNGVPMKAGPGATGSTVVVDWYYDIGCRRERRQREERDALRARAEVAEAEVARLRAELAQARAEGEAAGVARERAAVVGYLREQADEDHDPWLIHLADDVAAGQHWGAEAAMREAGAAGGGAR